MKADEEWDILERKLAGTEAGYEVRGSLKIVYKDVATNAEVPASIACLGWPNRLLSAYQVMAWCMQNIRVQCLVACVDDTGDDALLMAAKDAMNASCKLPAGYESHWPQLVLATLDINQGDILSQRVPCTPTMC